MTVLDLSGKFLLFHKETVSTSNMAGSTALGLLQGIPPVCGDWVFSH